MLFDIKTNICTRALIIELIVLVGFCFSSCDKLKHPILETAVAEAGGEVLTEQELFNMIDMSYVSGNDSLRIIDNYIKEWIANTVIYEEAQRSIPNQGEIDSLVEVYRHALVVYGYESQLIKDHVVSRISKDQMIQFYHENALMFRLDEPIAKGVFLIVPSSAPDVQVLETLMESPSESNLDIIESLSVKNAAKFEFFNNHWLFLSDIQKKCPLMFDFDALSLGGMQVQRDSVYSAFLYLSELKKPGEMQPFEFVEDRIRSILTEQKKIEFLRDYRLNLYEDALKSGAAKRYK